MDPTCSSTRISENGIVALEFMKSSNICHSEPSMSTCDTKLAEGQVGVAGPGLGGVMTGMTISSIVCEWLHGPECAEAGGMIRGAILGLTQLDVDINTCSEDNLRQSKTAPADHCDSHLARHREQNKHSSSRLVAKRLVPLASALVRSIEKGALPQVVLGSAPSGC